MIRKKIFSTNKREEKIIMTKVVRKRKKIDEEKAPTMEEKMMVEEKKKKKKKQREEEGRGREKRGIFFEISGKDGPVKRKKITHLNVWFRLNGLGSSQTVNTVSFTTDALVGVGSLGPWSCSLKTLWEDLTSIL